jgi:oligogalacturonide transporter
MDKKPSLSFKQIISYASGDIFGGGAFALVGLLFLRFLTDSALISAGIAGTMLLIGKIWDAIIDPYIGHFTDVSNSKLGRRRIFFLAGIFHISAAFALLWLPLNTAMWIKAIYYTLAYMLFATSFSMTMVPYHALLADMSKNYNERNKLIGTRTIVSNLSTLIAGVVPLLIVNAFADRQIGWFVMGISFGIFYALPWIIVFMGTKEEPYPILANENNSNPLVIFLRNSKIVLKNRSYMLLLGLYIFGYTAIDAFTAINIYYIADYLNIPNSYTILIGIFIISQILFVPVYIKIANTFGKKYSHLIGAGIWGITLILLLFVQPGTSPIVMYIASFFMGAGASGVAFSPWGMLPETTDVEELISTKRREGVYSGFMTFIRQLSQAIALFLTGIYLDLIGYRVPEIANQIVLQSNQTLNGIKLFYSLAPLLLLIISILFTIKYPIDHKAYYLMQEEINRLKNNNSKNSVLQETKETLEKITGQKYENLYK